MSMVDVANSIDGYYQLLGVPRDADAKALKRAYRKRSLKFHPDKKGGDTQTFQCLNRAFVVLRDPKRRKRYDILGLDIDEDDTERSDATTSSYGNNKGDSSEEDDDASGLPSTLSKESEMTREIIAEFGVRLLQISIALICTQYNWTFALVMLLAIASTAYGIKTSPKSELLSHVASAGFTFAMGCLLWWSTREGYLFWLCESIVLYLGLFQAGGGYLVGLAKHIGFLGICVCIAWWFNGRAWAYGISLVVVALSWILAFFFFLLAGMLIESIVDEKLKRIAPKIRTEVAKLRQECIRLRKRAQG